MKKIIYFIFIASILAGCVSSKKHLQQGRYDMAIRKAAAKLRKKPANQKEIYTLSEAYRLANQGDMEKINFLKVSGEPDIWNQVFDLYNNMKNRQRIVKTLPENVLSSINYKYINYDQEIIEAKKKAAEFFYAHAMTLLNKNDRMAAREAYYELTKVKEYYTTYKDVDEQINKALFMGTNNVLFSMENKTGIPLPPSFEEDLTKISLKDLNRMWLNYDTKAIKDRYYDYLIMVNIKIIDVSPEHLKEVHYSESKEVADGWQYVLDKSGNVMKDSTGNDIKVKKVKTITCNIIETQQKKSAIVGGSLDFIDKRTSQLMKTDPITAEAIFEHFSATAIGDLNALKPETKRKIGRKPLPFPNDPSMILQAGDILKGMTKDIIYRNKHLLK